MLRKIFAACALSLVAACGPAIQRSAGETYLEPAVMLDVANDHWSDVDVVLVLGQTRRRLGMVQGGANAHFVLPNRLFVAGNVACVRLEPRDKSGAWTSEPLGATSGKTIAFRVAPDIGASMRIW